MTVEQLCCLSFGIVVNAATFALGIMAGATLRRKEPNHGASQPGTEATLTRR